jgi:hypothetical protein
MSIVYDDRPPFLGYHVDDKPTALTVDAKPRLAHGRRTAVVKVEATGNTRWVTTQCKHQDHHQSYNRADMEHVVEEFSRLLEEDGI